MPATPAYDHVQRGPLFVLLYGLGALYLWLGGLLQDEPVLAWIFPPLGVLMFVVGASFHHLRVTDREDRLRIAFGPLPLFRRTVFYAEIESAEVGRTLVLDGIGIHWSLRGGWVWNIWGRDCVVVRLGGGRLRIGSNDAANLAEFLRTRIRDSRT